VVNSRGITFWLLGTLVTVRYTFFLLALLLGLQRRSVAALLSWAVVSFVAVLLHELAHALAARFYRQTPQIELHGMGGVTTWTWRGELRWYQRVWISLAGPGIGFLIGGLLVLAGTLAPSDPSSALELARRDFLWVTLAWGVFNLLPILPLDGGQALLEVLERVMGRDRGRYAARVVSCVAGFGAAILALAAGLPWAGLLCGVFAFDNLQRMRGQPGIQMTR
jgi:stage IV sporulation protein FB